MTEYEQKICNIIDNLKAEMRYQCDKVNEQAYKQGHKRGYAEGYEIGKQDGYEDGKADTPFTDTEEAEKTAYNRGLNDAWEVARKLVHPRLGGYTEEQKQRIFGTYVSSDSSLQNFSASEVIAKIKAYEDKQKQDDWRDIPSDEMTLEQARRAVKELRAEVVGKILAEGE